MPNKRDVKFLSPTTEAELDSVCRLAYGLACKGKCDEALEICNALIAEEATRVAGYRQRAAVKEYMSDVDGAIRDLQAVTVALTDEPADFYSLGILLLQNGATVEAIDAFGTAISISRATGNNYYLNGSLLFRAEAYLKINDCDEALVDVQYIPSGYKTYIPGSGMRSKEDIFSEATASLARKSSFKFRP